AIPRTRLSPSASSPRCRPATPPLFQVVPNIRSPVAAITGTRIDPTNDSSFSEAIPSLSLTRLKAKEWFERFPKQAYWTEIESWFERPGDIIEFTIRRLPAAD